MYPRHYQSSALVNAAPQELFEHLDDPARLSGHMSKSSWMMGGGKMSIETDEGRGRAVGSHIRLSGRAMGLQLYLDEVVTKRLPPVEKIWETVDLPRLLVIGDYRMGFTITGQDLKSQLKVFIDYTLPPTGWTRWLGRLFGDWYARWCTRQMAADAMHHFAGRKDTVARAER